MGQQMACCWRATRDEYFWRMRDWNRRMIWRARSEAIMLLREASADARRAGDAPDSRFPGRRGALPEVVPPPEALPVAGGSDVELKAACADSEALFRAAAACSAVACSAATFSAASASAASASAFSAAAFAAAAFSATATSAASASAASASAFSAVAFAAAAFSDASFSVAAFCTMER